MSLIDKIFAVIDPTTQTQRALNRAVLGAKSAGASIHVYACIYSSLRADDPEALQNVETIRYKAWIDGLVRPIQQQGVEVDVEIEWNEDWRNAVGAAATRAKSDLIIKNSHRRTRAKRTLLSSADWSLFRTATCPVMLAKSERSSGSGNVLLAVNFSKGTDGYKAFLDQMLDFARAAEKSYDNGELHVLSAYEGSEDYVQSSDLAGWADVPAERIHVMGGRPETAIISCADELDAELIVLGGASKSRLTGLLFGSNTEWLLNHMDRDIMVVIAKDQ